MRKIRAFIIFILIPLITGYLVASAQGHKVKLSSNINFDTNIVLQTDNISLTEKGTIISLTHTGTTSIPTNHSALTETIPVGNNFIGVDKQTNYTSLDEFSTTGKLIKTLQDGNTGNIDTMNWFTDPSIDATQQKIAFVSDKDKENTYVLDNALFIENLATSSIQKIAAPDPHSGGITHPIWDPANPDIITYDYYQYDKNYSPYSIIEKYNMQSQTTTPLTTQAQNAYQGAFSPDGKQFIFLGRNNDITPVMYIANVTTEGLSNIHILATGNFAYPEFSNTASHIYYLQAQGNSGYDLYAATITNDKISGSSPISTGEQLEATSGFIVSKK
ncbi:MAG TPA: hypothetical protein VNW29_00125 [Candidatus Sulfotelmatobacter sp.]|jgi:hypothetical protein|nr:hypothetical protein [Candidatus Sulfotelmatobacter sp.]